MQIETPKNKQGGIDLLIGDGEHNVRIETADKKNSLQYWQHVRETADKAIKELTQPSVHVIVINNNGVIKQRTHTSTGKSSIKLSPKRFSKLR